jgi:hypothetical protein
MSGPYVSEATRARVRTAAGDRCGYCLVPSAWSSALLEIDHLLPVAEALDLTIVAKAAGLPPRDAARILPFMNCGITSATRTATRSGR